MEKITTAMNPQFEDDQAIDPFDLWTGANFKLKIRKVDGYQNYDLSEFDSPSPLSDSDDELKRIWETEHSLHEVVSESNFKSYDELKKKLDKVLGVATTSSARTNTVQAVKTSNIEAEERKLEETFTDSLDSDDDLDYFKDLLSDE